MLMYAFECFKDLDSITSSETGTLICVRFNEIPQIFLTNTLILNIDIYNKEMPNMLKKIHYRPYLPILIRDGLSF